MEWKTVVLLDDFLSIPNQDPDDCEYKLKDLERLPDDEKNLIYVALTRAKVRTKLIFQISITNPTNHINFLNLSLQWIEIFVNSVHLLFRYEF